MADSLYYTIGNVVKILKDRYPDITVSKIRFLQDEGLVNPIRSKSGYRMYSQNDIDRLDKILYLQKTRYLPLSVIKDELDKDTSELPSEENTHEIADVPVFSKEITSRLHSIERVPEIVGPSVGFVRELSEAGVINLIRSPHGRILVEGSDFTLIWVCFELRRLGIAPKNLRQYVIAANRESALYEQSLVVYVKKAGGVEIQNKDEMHRQFDESLTRILDLSSFVKNTLIRRKVTDPYSNKESHEDITE